MTLLFRIRAFITYWLLAVDKHSLHSPFFFELYTKVIRQHKGELVYEPIELLRKKLLADNRELIVTDLGAGALSGKKSVTISAIAKTSLTPPKFSALYQRIINYYMAENIVELGTSLGINTLYLSARDNARVTTFEGSPAIAYIASLTFEFMGSENITLIEGNIDATLPSFLQRSTKLDVVFMDANHRYEPTLKYFDWILKRIHARSIVIMDDIHYSPEMQKAWEVMCRHELVYGSADLYRCGLLFFDPSLNKQHVVLQF